MLLWKLGMGITVGQSIRRWSPTGGSVAHHSTVVAVQQRSKRVDPVWRKTNCACNHPKDQTKSFHGAVIYLYAVDSAASVFQHSLFKAEVKET
eukprot:scaffold2182_cov198-Amphora_coffeaeformis.AAC.15